MKIIDLFSILPAVTNGWTFAAFIVVVVVWLRSHYHLPTRVHLVVVFTKPVAFWYVGGRDSEATMTFIDDLALVSYAHYCHYGAWSLRIRMRWEASRVRN
jgi:hypothetical protein